VRGLSLHPSLSAFAHTRLQEQSNDSDALTAMGSIRGRLESDRKRHRSGGWRGLFERAAAAGGSIVLRKFALLLEEKGQWGEAVKVRTSQKEGLSKEMCLILHACCAGVGASKGSDGEGRQARIIG